MMKLTWIQSDMYAHCIELPVEVRLLLVVLSKYSSVLSFLLK